MAKEKESIVQEARERFRRALDATSENREQALDDLKFARLGEQWPADILKARKEEGRPCLTINKMPAFVRQVVNDARQNKPSIKVHPVDSAGDVETAEILDGLIRNIEVSSASDIAWDTAIDSSVTVGFGYARINVDYARDDTFDQDIVFERVMNPFSVYEDVDATAGDGSDWRWCFVTEWLDKDEFESRYPQAEMADWDEAGAGDESTEWVEEDKVRVAEYWTREEVEYTLVRLSDGSVMRREQYDKNRGIFDAAGLTIDGERQAKTWRVMQHILAGTSDEPVASTEWPGKYIPIVPVYGDEVQVEGKRYYKSLIRDAKDAQKMFNFWRTNATEMVALAPKTPFIGPEGAFDADPGKWATANVKSHAFIEYSGQIPPQRQPYAGPPTGALQEALNAADDMKAIIGIYDASLGARSNETSGRAIMARQREGDVSTFHFIDNLSRAIRQAGRVLVDLIPKVYNKPRVLRILGEDLAAKTVQVNQPIPGLDRIYDLSVGRYDVTVSVGPSFTSRREEVTAQLTELIRAFPQAASLLGDVLAKNMDWPEADKVAARFRAMLPPQIQQAENQGADLPPEAAAIMSGLQQQLQAQQQQMQAMDAQAREAIAKLQADAARLSGENQRLQLENANKIAEIQATMQRAVLDAQTKLQLAEINGQQDQREIILKAHLEAQAMQMGEMRNLIERSNRIAQGLPVEPEQEPPEKPKRKVMRIVAPSGATYEGVIEETESEDGQEQKTMMVTTPSGQVMRGVMQEGEA